MGLCRVVIMCFALGLCRNAMASEPLQEFETQYSATLYGFSIDVTSRLSLQTNNQYEFYFNADALIGEVTERSHVHWNENEQSVTPVDYTYKRRGLGKSRKDALTFDWNKRTVMNTEENSQWTMPGTQKIQSELSYQLQLRQDLINGKSNLTYSIADRKGIKDYHFEVVGEELLETPLGTVKTVKVMHGQNNKKRVTYAWFAKDFHYLLVRLQQEANGSAYTIYISKATVNGKAIEHF